MVFGGAFSLSRAPARLVLHEELWTPDDKTSRQGGCARWPETLRLVASDGTVTRGRCRSVNLCSYCAKLGAIENAEMLALDALEYGAPQVWACLTTRSADSSPSAFYRARRKVRNALRRRWPDCQDATMVEFTTGYGRASGGLRRPHWNAMLKGVTPESVEEVREVVSRVWCGQVDAEVSRQHVDLISDAGGLTRYLALHFQKESQAPPIGWRGQRFNASRGYFPLGAVVARAKAKESLRLGRACYWANAVAEGVWLDEEEVMSSEEMDEVIRDRLLEEAARSWELKRVAKQSMDPARVTRREARKALRKRPRAA